MILLDWRWFASKEKNVICIQNFNWLFSWNLFIKYYSLILIKLLWYTNILRSYFSQTGNSYVNNLGCITWEELLSFNPTPTNIQTIEILYVQTQEHFEKIRYKCISLCSFVCFELSFKAFESLERLIFPCGTLLWVKIFQILVQLCDFIRDFNSLNGENDATALNNHKN